MPTVECYLQSWYGFKTPGAYEENTEVFMYSRFKIAKDVGLARSLGLAMVSLSLYAGTMLIVLVLVDELPRVDLAVQATLPHRPALQPGVVEGTRETVARSADRHD